MPISLLYLSIRVLQRDQLRGRRTQLSQTSASHTHRAPAKKKKKEKKFKKRNKRSPTPEPSLPAAHLRLSAPVLAPLSAGAARGQRPPPGGVGQGSAPLHPHGPVQRPEKEICDSTVAEKAKWLLLVGCCFQGRTAVCSLPFRSSGSDTEAHRSLLCCAQNRDTRHEFSQSRGSSQGIKLVCKGSKARLHPRAPSGNGSVGRERSSSVISGLAGRRCPSTPSRS